MENQNQQVDVIKEEKKQENYWKFAYKVFFFFSCASFFFFFGGLIVSLTKPSFIMVVGAIQAFTSSVIWLLISQLFKKENKNAIVLAYLFVGYHIIFTLIFDIKIIYLIIDAWLVWVIYKASKTKTNIINN
jgi:hypothetical protein